jgi:uncharacterized protein with HEPN domain
LSKRDIAILIKIVDEASALNRILNGLDESGFLSNDVIVRASCMTLLNVGELIKNLSDDFRAKHKHVPWRDMAGFRDVAAHGYFTLRMEEVWIYASNEMPVFADQIKEILENEEKAD